MVKIAQDNLQHHYTKLLLPRDPSIMHPNQTSPGRKSKEKSFPADRPPDPRKGPENERLLEEPLPHYVPESNQGVFFLYHCFLRVSPETPSSVRFSDKDGKENNSQIRRGLLTARVYAWIPPFKSFLK